MRFVNRYTAPIDGVAPGESGDFDPASPSVSALRAAGLLEPCEGEASDVEPTAAEVRASITAANVEIEQQRSVIEGLRAELEESRASAAKNASAMQSSIDELVRELRKADAKASSAAAERDGMLSELNTLRAQLATKADSAPAGDAAPDAAPAKKGKG